MTNTADTIYTIEQAREQFARCVSVGLDVRCLKQDFSHILEKLKAELQPFAGGQCPVQIRYASSEAKAVLQLGEAWRIQPTDELLHRLRCLADGIEVEVKYR